MGTDGVVYGPVPLATLFEWVAQGRVVPGTVLIDWQGRRLVAASLPELQGAFPPVAPPIANGFPPTAPYGGPTKSKRTALLLAFFLGPFGAHRFYLGHPVSGVAMLLLNLSVFAVTSNLEAVVAITVATTVWLIVDMALIAAGKLAPRDGSPLR